MNIPWIPMIIWLQSIEIHWPHPSSKAQVRSTAELLVAVRGLHRHPVADAEVERPGTETLLEAEGFPGAWLEKHRWENRWENPPSSHDSPGF